MVLVDTSVWINHLRAGDRTLRSLLEADEVLTHPFVVGEVALGNMRQRGLILEALVELPQAVVANDDEVLAFVAQRRLFGLGIGYIDAHLLVAAQLSSGVKLWTRDKQLLKVATSLGLARSTA